MKVIRYARTLKNSISRLRLRPIGFVPTMGALHEGHLSLVSMAIDECPIAVVSIYVNPTQFNDPEDLKNYPRTPVDDLNLLRGVMRRDDMVFLPSDKEIYPGEDKRRFSFGNLDNVMEAARRPGHFNGVGQVVSRLFDIVTPDIAYFGRKDFQQLAVIKELVRQTGSNVKIIGAPTVRENDGLAMSSRNRLLEPAFRKNAPVIFRTLTCAAEMIHDHDIPEIKKYVKESIEKVNGFIVEYFEIVDDNELVPVKHRAEMEKTKSYFGCVAVKAGEIRLIDNIEFTV